MVIGYFSLQFLHNSHDLRRAPPSYGATVKANHISFTIKPNSILQLITRDSSVCPRWMMMGPSNPTGSRNKLIRPWDRGPRGPFYSGQHLFKLCSHTWRGHRGVPYADPDVVGFWLPWYPDGQLVAAVAADVRVRALLLWEKYKLIL